MSDTGASTPAGVGDARILTVPDELDAVEPVVAIANDHLAIPDVHARTGSIPSITLLHDQAAGLLELRGAPIAAPQVRIDRAAVPDHAWTLDPTDPLVPVWRATLGGCELAWTLACPPGHAGAVLQLTATASSRVEVELGIAGEWLEPSLHVFSARPIHGPHRARLDRWTDALTAEVSTGLPVAALAVRAADGAWPELTAADAREGSDGAPLPIGYHHRRTAELADGETADLTVLLGAARERDGAALTCISLARTGVPALLAATRRWQDDHRGPTLEDPDRQAVRDRNRLFCLGFAAGRTIDTDERVLVTSRSPRYYVSGAHWSRDTLRWAFPAVLAVDPPLAAEWLRAAFTRYARNPGIHALYLDGTVLYPGFELDEAAAFPLALDAYVEVTGDTALAAEPSVRDGLAAVDARIADARDATTGLYATELLSTDDPAPLPFVTYSNALTVAALRARARLHRRQGPASDGGTADTGGAADTAETADAADAADRAADELWDAVRTRCIVDGPDGPLFAGATDGDGTHVRFDEPPGSLELLAHLGVVDRDDPVFHATVAWIHGTDNPFGPPAGRYPTPICEHAHHPWVLAVGNALLRGDDRWLRWLPQLPLDGGLACETFDVDTGEPRTGLGFATCAGWLAHAIDVAVERAAERADERATDPATGPATDPGTDPARDRA